MKKTTVNKPQSKKVDKKLLLAEVRSRLSKMDLPKELQLEAWAKITDVSKFLESHISVVENSDNDFTKPYAERLKKALGMLGIDLTAIAKELMNENK